jgi:hypothetical protein
VPVTVTLSILIFVSWAVCLLVAQTLQGLLGGIIGPIVAGLAAMTGAFLVGMMAAAIAARPLSKVFVTHGASRKDQLVGKLCTIKTGRVDERFGQAVFERNGDEILISVRAETPNDLVRGAIAVIVDYESKDDVFLVASAASIMKNLPGGGGAA